MNRSGIVVLATAAAVVGALSVIVITSTTLKDAISEARSGDLAAADRVLELWAGQWKASNQIEFAKLYASGKGIRQDNSEAVSWYRRAAENGSAEAQNKLGIAYEIGLGAAMDYGAAMEWYRKAADQGYVPAMLNVSRFYSDGLGIPKSESDAFTWVRKAGEQGDVIGQVVTGMAYRQGNGTQVDNKEAAKWLRKAADQGNAKAEFMLSTMYLSGDGIPQDAVQARKWMEKAADQGYAEAQFDMGAMYFNGTGVTQDVKASIQFFLKAAAQGNADAQEALGRFYNAGRWDTGIRQNKVLAYVFFNLAAAQGQAQATKEKADLSGFMTAEQIESGQAISSSWKVGDELPSNTPVEDKAPQYLYGSSATPALMKATRILFSRDFSVSGTNYRVVFLATKGEDCHPCGAHVGAVTFRYENGALSDWAWPQPNVAEVGSFGEAPDLADENAAFDSPARVVVDIYALSEDRAAMTLTDTGGGQGIEGTFKNILAFDPASGWRAVGIIQTAGDDSGAGCREVALGAALVPGEDLPCYSWTGILAIDPTGKKDWPDFIVKATGTDLPDGPGPIKLVSVSDVRYRYEGGKYVPSKGKGQP